MLKHAFVSAAAVATDPNKVRSSNWNAEHTFDGGTVNALLARDTDAVEGASWTHTPAVDLGSGTAQMRLNGLLAATVDQAQTGANTTETTLWRYVLPANTLAQRGDGIVVNVYGLNASNTNTKTVKVYFGASSFFLANASGTSAALWFGRFKIWRTGNANQQYFVREIGSYGGSAVSFSLSSVTENLASDIEIKVTGTNGTASFGDIVLYGAHVDAYSHEAPRHVYSFGDSVTAGSPGYVSLMVGRPSYSGNNYGTASARVTASGYIDNIFARTITPHSVSTSLVGYNDYRDDGTDATKYANFKDGLTAALLYLAVPACNVVTPANMTLVGSWSSTASYGLTGKSSSTPGDTATFTTRGSTVYIVGTRLASGGGTMKITVDGVDGATYSCNGGNTSREGRTYQPFVMRVSGLVAGTLHTVKATVVSGLCEVNFGVSNYNPNSTPGPYVLAGNGMKMTAANYLANSTAGSDTAAALYATGTSDVVATLVSDGLNVQVVDTIDAYDPNTGVSVDGVHPSYPTGYQMIAGVFDTALDAL